MRPRALVVMALFTGLTAPAKHSRIFAAVLGALLLSGATLPTRADTKQWTQNLIEDFQSGKTDKVSLRSDGRLVLAPRFRELYDAPSSYLWALAADSKGNLYAAGGPDAKVFRIAPDGAAETFFEAAAVEVHALAIDASDNVYAATSPESKIYTITPAGEHSLFFEPGLDYVWDMA